MDNQMIDGGEQLSLKTCQKEELKQKEELLFCRKKITFL